MKKQIWTGIYSYDATGIDEIPENAPTLEFQLEIDEEGGISGKLIDSVYAALTPASVILRGFVEGDFVSLVAHYPFRMHRASSGEFVLNLESVDQEVPIYGEISEDQLHMSGTCEQVESTFLEHDAIDDVMRVGFFKVALQTN